jgi:hypothetical protein
LTIQASNNPPLYWWRPWPLSTDGVKRERLMIGERVAVAGRGGFKVWRETPFFVDRSKRRARFTLGEPVGLFGSGMDPSGCAATLWAGTSVRKAKARAIELWEQR